MLNHLHIAIMVLLAALYACAYLLALRHMRRSLEQQPAPAPASMGFHARLLVALATLAAAALLIWRASWEHSVTLPLSDHLDAFLVLALLLAVALIYFRWTRHLGRFSFYILPMIVVVLLLGALLEIAYPVNYNYTNAWTLVHVAAVMAGSLCFALACVGGIVYLLAARQLKRKHVDPARPRWLFPPLGSLEKFNQWMVYLGFPLLTLAMITGILRLSQWAGSVHWHAWPKITLALLAWIVYALLLPLAPSFRGRRAAWLSIAGFFFMLGAYVAANWIK